MRRWNASVPAAAALVRARGAAGASPHAGVLALQRAAGNRATCRLLQRYTKVPASANWAGLGFDLRVSDDGEMAVKDSGVYPEGQGRALQKLWASDRVIKHAKQRLSANGSIYEVHRGSRLDGAANDLYEVEVENKVLGTRGSSVGTLLNCNNNTGQALGVNDLHEDYGKKPQLAVKLGPGGQRIRPSAPDQFGNDAMAEARAEITGKDDVEKAKKEYGGMKSSKKAERAEQAGVNQAADAHAGEGYGIWASYGSHFAPVIAESGGDRVTLEAHFQSKAAQFPGMKPGEADWNNPEWYFRMYGQARRGKKGKIVEDQSFYGEYAEAAKKDKDESVMVVAFGKLSQPGTKQEIRAEQLALAKHAGAEFGATAGFLKKQPFKDPRGLDAAVAALTKDAGKLADGSGASALVDRWVTELQADLGRIDATVIPADYTRTTVVNKLSGQLRRLRRYLLQLRHLDEAWRTAV